MNESKRRTNRKQLVNQELQRISEEKLRAALIRKSGVWFKTAETTRGIWLHSTFIRLRLYERQLAQMLDTITSKKSIHKPIKRESQINGERETIKYDLGLSEQHIRAVLKSQTMSSSAHNSITDTKTD